MAGFFAREELALVGELAEMIIPADAHSPGARAANVAEYIDARLAEAADGSVRKTWREGLKLVEQRTQAAGSWQHELHPVLTGRTGLRR